MAALAAEASGRLKQHRFMLRPALPAFRQGRRLFRRVGRITGQEDSAAPAAGIQRQGQRPAGPARHIQHHKTGARSGQFPGPGTDRPIDAGQHIGRG